MEKYSAFRDPGTGIQPFLTPVPPSGSETFAKLLLPFGVIIGAVRLLLVLALAVAYLIVVEGLSLLLAPIPPAKKAVAWLLTAIIARLVLLLVGFFWIPVEQVTRKRGIVKKNESWSPRAGDIIVSNWVSWIEVLWLAFRFDPIFVLPVVEIAPDLAASSRPATPITGRQTGTGSAAVSSSAKLSTVRGSITGFRRLSLLSTLRHTGKTPFSESASSDLSLESIRASADRPLVVFPECTTSNGRGILRFSKVFGGQAVPVMKWKVFIMCARYDPPTPFKPTLSHAIPTSLNPLPHLFSIATSLSPANTSIRLLAPLESPSSPLFMVSEVVTGMEGEDMLSEACASLISQIGKMRRTIMGWEEKVEFLKVYQGKRK